MGLYVSLCMGPGTETALMADGEPLICQVKKNISLTSWQHERKEEDIVTNKSYLVLSQHCCQNGGENSKANVRNR